MNKHNTWVVFSWSSLCQQCEMKGTMLVTWFAFWCERSRPTQRRRRGVFCTATAWSNRGKQVKNRPAELFRRKKKKEKKTAAETHCLHLRTTVTNCCDRDWWGGKKGEAHTEEKKKTPSVNHAQSSRCLSKQGAAPLNRVGPPRCPH